MQFCSFIFIILLKSFLKICSSSEVADSSDVFGHCLLELRLPELLRLKHSLDRISERQQIYENKYIRANETEEPCTVEHGSAPGPTAMALVGKARGHSSYSSSGLAYHHQTGLPDEKPSKLQTLFQISITALAFLSFGGYLLCLIVQAIKSKGTTYFHPVATATTTTLNGGLKRIKIYRRSRR